MKKLRLPDESKRIAQCIAAEHYIYMGEDNTMSSERAYELAQTEDFYDNDLEVTSTYEHDEESHVTAEMRGMADDMERKLSSYRDNIKAGMVMYAKADKLPMDASTFDVDQFAKLGHLRNATVEVDGEPFKLDAASAQWISVNDKSVIHDINFDNNFMPDVEGEKVYIFGVGGDVKYIVDESDQYEATYSM
jgi:hypothetical protein